MAGNRVPVAVRVGGEVRYLVQADLMTHNDWHGRLTRGISRVADTPRAA